MVEAIVGDAACRRLERLAALVITENERQNLIARSTIATIWSRHILDSVQLLRWARTPPGSWLDIGTGGGFPGLAIAAAIDGDMILVEPRRLRSRFLTEAAASLGLSRTTVATAKVESISVAADTISARAVAPVEALLSAARHCATSETRWLMLRGKPTVDESSMLERTFGMVFHVEQSLSNPLSSVLIADGKPAA